MKRDVVWALMIMPNSWSNAKLNFLTFPQFLHPLFTRTREAKSGLNPSIWMCQRLSLKNPFLLANEFAPISVSGSWDQMSLCQLLLLSFFFCSLGPSWHSSGKFATLRLLKKVGIEKFARERKIKCTLQNVWQSEKKKCTVSWKKRKKKIWLTIFLSHFAKKNLRKTFSTFNFIHKFPLYYAEEKDQRNSCHITNFAYNEANNIEKLEVCDISAQKAF